MKIRKRSGGLSSENSGSNHANPTLNWEDSSTPPGEIELEIGKACSFPKADLHWKHGVSLRRGSTHGEHCVLFRLESDGSLPPSRAGRGRNNEGVGENMGTGVQFSLAIRSRKGLSSGM